METFIQYAPLKRRVRKAGRATDPQITVYCDSAVSSHSQWGGPAGPDHERDFLSLFLSGFPAPTDLVRTRYQSCQFSFALIKTVGMLKMLTVDSFSLQICWKGVMTMNESIMWVTLAKWRLLERQTTSEVSLISQLFLLNEIKWRALFVAGPQFYIWHCIHIYAFDRWFLFKATCTAQGFSRFYEGKYKSLKPV